MKKPKRKKVLPSVKSKISYDNIVKANNENNKYDIMRNILDARNKSEGKPSNTRDVRNHDLSGAGHAGGPGASRVHAGQGRLAASGHGQEEAGGDGGAARCLR